MVRPSFRPSPSSTLPVATGRASVSTKHDLGPEPTPKPFPRSFEPSSHKSRQRVEEETGPPRRPPKDTDHPLVPRQGASSGPVFENYPSCDNVGNTLLSCFPLANTTITQSTWSKFIWNANYPTFVERHVDVWLYQADSGEEVTSWRGITNGQGSIAIRPEEDWWKGQDRATELTPGGSETYSFYFVVVPGGETLDGGEPHQNTFRAVQTALPSTVLASLSSASVASASSASIVAARSSSSASAAATATDTTPGGRGPDGTPQSANSGGSAFPKWAIAVIVILGVFLIISLLALWWFLLAAARRNRRRDSRVHEGKAWKGEEAGHAPDKSVSTVDGVPKDQKHDETVQDRILDEKVPLPRQSGHETSAVPIASFATNQDDTKETSSVATARPASRQSRASPIPMLKPSLLALNRQKSGTSAIGSHTSVHAPSGASHSVAGAETSSIASSGPISPSDAEDLAVAFRQAMRKAGDQPLTEDSSPETESPPVRTPASTLMRRELHGEGVGIQPVGDRRSYHLQGPDNDDD